MDDVSIMQALSSSTQHLRHAPGDDLIIYLNGHGGEGFFKFRDDVEVTAEQLGAALVSGAVAGAWRRGA